jgi:hypothetical protein
MSKMSTARLKYSASFTLQPAVNTGIFRASPRFLTTMPDMSDNHQVTTSKKLQNVAANASATTQNAARGAVGTAGGILGGAVSAAGSAVGSVGKGLGVAKTDLAKNTEKSAQGASDQICETTGVKQHGQKEGMEEVTILGSQ